MTDDARANAVALAIGFYGVDAHDAMSPRQLVDAFDALRAHDAAIPTPRSDEIAEESMPVTLADCPIGLFRCGDELCFKTKYSSNKGRVDAYIVSSGALFWGPEPATAESQRATAVRPVNIAHRQLAPAGIDRERVRAAIKIAIDTSWSYAASGATWVECVEAVYSALMSYGGANRDFVKMLVEITGIPCAALDKDTP